MWVLVDKVGLEERRGVGPHRGGMRAALGVVLAAAEEEVEGRRDIRRMRST